MGQWKTRVNSLAKPTSYRVSVQSWPSTQIERRDRDSWTWAIWARWLASKFYLVYGQQAYISILVLYATFADLHRTSYANLRRDGHSYGHWAFKMIDVSKMKHTDIGQNVLQLVLLSKQTSLKSTTYAIENCLQVIISMITAGTTICMTSHKIGTTKTFLREPNRLNNVLQLLY